MSFSQTLNFTNSKKNTATAAIKYVDTQVKYDTEYTYKIFSYVLLLGYKYQTTDLVATRKIAEEGDQKCDRSRMAVDQAETTRDGRRMGTAEEEGP